MLTISKFSKVLFSHFFARFSEFLAFPFQLYLSLKKERDFGTQFKKQVQRREGIFTHGGTTTASTAGTTHTVRFAEQVAFSNWINS